MNIDEFTKKYGFVTVKKWDKISMAYVYFICEPGGKIIYIGSTRSIYVRLREHIYGGLYGDKEMYYMLVPAAMRLKIEKKLILKIKPRDNKQNKPAPSGLDSALSLSKKMSRKHYPNGDRVRRKIKKIIKKKDIKIIDLAKKMGVSRQSVYAFLSEVNSVRYCTVGKYADALGVSFESLIK